MSTQPEPTRNERGPDRSDPTEELPRLDQVDEIPRPGQQTEDVEEVDRRPPGSV